MRRFNVTGLCVPEEDYMADISGKIEQIKRLIDDRCYFTINRARQYGKTTMLAALERALKNEYIIASISFQGFGIKSFESPDAFCQAFIL
jgi:predicted AAA+ superfamily ATPase